MNTLDELPTLTVSRLLAALLRETELPLRVIWPDGEAIEAHFHVTEVGRVQKDFVDCGGTVRQVRSCLLQTWVGDDTDHRVTTGKLAKAFAHATRVLGAEDLPVELEYETCNVVQLRVVSAETVHGCLELKLARKHTDCLAMELCVPQSRGVAAKGCC